MNAAEADGNVLQEKFRELQTESRAAHTKDPAGLLMCCEWLKVASK